MADKIKGVCHCGAVTFEVSEPEFVVSCNCSVCRRYGALWAHCPPNEDAILTGEDHTKTYSWDNHLINFHACKTCNCVTHWAPGQNADKDRFAVNLRMAPLEEMNRLTIRRLDGAESWEFLD